MNFPATPEGQSEQPALMAGGCGCNGDKLAAGLLFFSRKGTFSATDHIPKCPREKLCLLLFRDSSHNVRKLCWHVSKCSSANLFQEYSGFMPQILMVMGCQVSDKTLLASYIPGYV